MVAQSRSVWELSPLELVQRDAGDRVRRETGGWCGRGFGMGPLVGVDYSPSGMVAVFRYPGEPEQRLQWTWKSLDAGKPGKPYVPPWMRPTKAGGR